MRVIEIALIILTNTPIKSVSANPFTSDVPNQKRISVEMILEILLSRMDGHARVNPSRIASATRFPPRISSFIRSKIRIFASTAIPIERINPAIPAAVRVIGISLKSVSIMAT